MNKKFFTWGTTVVGVAFVVAGLALAYLGWHTNSEIIENLQGENIETQDPAVLLSYEGARAPEGVEVAEVVVDSPAEADAMAQVIHEHTMSITGGLTYTEMGREDPNRDLYLNSLILQTTLHQAHLGFEITYLVLGIGTAFTGLGVAILALGLPIVKKVVSLK
jgi:hypothetical protein